MLNLHEDYGGSDMPRLKPPPGSAEVWDPLRSRWNAIAPPPTCWLTMKRSGKFVAPCRCKGLFEFCLAEEFLEYIDRTGLKQCPECGSLYNSEIMQALGSATQRAQVESSSGRQQSPRAHSEGWATQLFSVKEGGE